MTFGKLRLWLVKNPNKINVDFVVCKLFRGYYFCVILANILVGLQIGVHKTSPPSSEHNEVSHGVTKREICYSNRLKN